jgi:hypothetical protein
VKRWASHTMRMIIAQCLPYLIFGDGSTDFVSCEGRRGVICSGLADGGLRNVVDPSSASEALIVIRKKNKKE